MEDATRLRLLGKYRTPRFRIGQRVSCKVRGQVVITGMTDAPIPCRQELNQAVASWWGIDPQTVTKWRRRLGVERATEGTSQLHSDYTQEPGAVEAFAQAHSKGRDEASRMSWEKFRELFETEYLSGRREDTRHGYADSFLAFERLSNPTALRGISGRTISA